jgi:siroheme decarboxylase
MITLESSLLNDYQREFPLCPRPFLTIARELGTREEHVASILAALRARSVVSRIGATIVPGRLGAATLAALSVPRERIEQVARIVSDYPEVNHNYEREHSYNLWFVVAAPARSQVVRVLREIERRAECGNALDLPMVAAFHVDLGFDLASGGAARTRTVMNGHNAPYVCSAFEARVLAALQDGLEITPRPYAALAIRAGATEKAVRDTIRDLIDRRVIARLGVIVSHHALGFRANAMAVWDLPDDLVVAAGERLARDSGVSLCYRRERARPAWPYNLYCMLHGKSRDAVAARAADLTLSAGLARHPRALLFSTRRFKQCAARYVA